MVEVIKLTKSAKENVNLRHDIQTCTGCVNIDDFLEGTFLAKKVNGAVEARMDNVWVVLGDTDFTYVDKEK